MWSKAGIEHLLGDYGYGLVFVVIGLEAMGIPLPGESIIIAAAIYAASTGKLAVGWVIAAAAAGAIMGDNAGYIIGRWLGMPMIRRYGRHVGLTEPRLDLGRYLFRRHGGKVVFLGRFIAILRTFVALLAGANNMAWKSFLLWNAVGGIAWAGLYGLGAYMLGSVMTQLQGRVGWAIAAVGIVCAATAIFLLRRNERRLEAHAQEELKRDPAEKAS